MDEREMFEAWARTCEGNCNDLDLYRENGEYAVPVVERDWIVWQAARRTTPDREAIELREAARQFYNMTIGDSTVKVSAPSAEKRDAIDDAGKRLRALIELIAPTSDKGGA